MSAKRFYFTVDLDRDANFPVPGRMEAGSLDRGSGPAPRFSSAERGLRTLLDILDGIGMKATFFVEGRTAEAIDCSCLSGHCIGFHGYDHEGLSGGSTGLDMGPEAVESVLRRGFGAVSDRISRPSCFRAPYMSRPDSVLPVLRDLGIAADSSEYASGRCSPYDLGGISEYPVPKSRDISGKTIAAYLWPMHEGKRTPQDYIRMAEDAGDYMMLADHAWHMCERREGGMMDAGQERKEASDVAAVLEGILDLGFSPGVLARRSPSF